MSLPDNVTENTLYTVRSTDADQGMSPITVSFNDVGNVRLRQDADLVLITPADVPGLIAALQAVAPPAQDGPAYVVDGDGDTWVRESSGEYLITNASLRHMAPRPLDEVRREFGIRESE